MRTKRKRVYPDQDLHCELCGQPFKNYQGLKGHLRMVHGVRDPKVNPGLRVETDQVVKSDKAIIESLKTEVEQLQLEAKKRRLQADFPSTSPGPRDIMESAGLGAIEGEAKILAQRRAMGLVDQGPATQSWLDKLLANPEGIRVAVAGLRGILGVDQNSGGLGVLKELGVDLKTLWERGQAPKSGAFEVAGINLSGASLTPELLSALLGYKGKVEAAQAELEGKKAQNELLANGLEKIGRAIGKAYAEVGASGPPHSGNVSPGIISDAPLEREDILVCPKCGAENQVPGGIRPGTVVECKGEGCQESWTIEDPRTMMPPKKAKQQPLKIQEPERISINCPNLNCRQAIDVSDKILGEYIRCPACQDEFQLISETETLPAMDPLTPEEKRWREMHGE